MQLRAAARNFPSGAIVKEVRLLPTDVDGGSAYMRNARELPDGHFLVAHYGADVVREYDAEGKLLTEIPAPGVDRIVSSACPTATP